MMELVVNGRTVLLDDEDGALVETGNLHIRNGGHNKPDAQYVYWRAGGPKQPEFSLARLILGLPHRERMIQADHINRNTLDNRRVNLRVVTPAENLKNRAPYTTTITHCRRSGHLYDDENTYRWDGRRYCKECRREADRARRSKERIGKEVDSNGKP